MEYKEYTKMHELETNHFWFVAKREIVKYFFNRYNLFQKGRALDIGCGTGAVLELYKTLGIEASGVDMSDVAVSFCKEKSLNALEGSAFNLPFEDSYFGIVSAYDVIEHLDDDIRAVSEMHRVLNKDGYAVITVPAHKWVWSYHDVFLHHKRRYTKKELKKLFSKDFEITYIGWIHAWIYIPVALVRIARKILGETQTSSDVRKPQAIVNYVASIFYEIEFIWLNIFGRLPFGLSLIVIAKKR